MKLRELLEEVKWKVDAYSKRLSGARLTLEEDGPRLIPDLARRLRRAVIGLETLKGERPENAGDLAAKILSEIDEPE